MIKINTAKQLLRLIITYIMMLFFITRIKMFYSLFAKTDKRIKQRFFNPPGRAVDDSSSNAGQDSSSNVGVANPIGTANFHFHRQLRLVPSKETQDELLEKLLRYAEMSNGQARSNYLEQLLIFLKSNPDMVNRVPNKFHSNPLELVIQIGDARIAQELLRMKANVRPENRHLLKRIEHLLRPQDLNKPKEIGAHLYR